MDLMIPHGTTRKGVAFDIDALLKKGEEAAMQTMADLKKKKANCTLFSWGMNVLGHGVYPFNVYEPDSVGALLKERISIVSSSGSAESSVCAAVTEHGKVYVWGRLGCLGGGLGGWCWNSGDEMNHQPAPLLLTALEDRWVVTVQVGSAHMVAITDKGELFTWGIDRGLLGRDVPPEPPCRRGYAPAPVPALRDYVVVSVAAGARHTVAVTSDNGVWAWGENGLFQLGLGDIETRTEPTRLSKFTDAKIMGVSVSPRYTGTSGDHTAVVTSSGTLFTWGSNSSFQLGHSGEQSGVPCEVDRVMTNGEAALLVSCGLGFTAVVDKWGVIFVWGIGFCSGDIPSPSLKLTLPHRVTHVSCGTDTMAALTEDGGLYTWGSDEQFLGVRRCGTGQVAGRKRQQSGMAHVEQLMNVSYVDAGTSCFHAVIGTPTWSPVRHRRFPESVRLKILTMMMLGRREDCLVYELPTEVLFLIFGVICRRVNPHTAL